jgi:hypothetical protein
MRRYPRGLCHTDIAGASQDDDAASMLGFDLPTCSSLVQITEAHRKIKDAFAGCFAPTGPLVDLDPAAVSLYLKVLEVA